MIRYMAAKGQSSDPNVPSYDPKGFRSCPGSSRWSPRPPARRANGTPRSRATSARSRCAPGTASPGDPARTGRRRRLGAARGLDALPAADLRHARLPGYVSGHSTFSRAAAEVMTALHRQPVLPRRPRRVRPLDPGVLVLEQARRSASGCSGRPTTTRPTRPAFRGSTAASTSAPTTSADGVSGSQGRQGCVDARPALLRRLRPSLTPRWFAGAESA